MKQQLIQLQDQGVKTVEFEIETTNHMAWQFAELLLLEKKKSWNSYYVETNLECTNNKLIFHEVFWEYKMA